jgi:hypothetical protein
MIFDREFRAHKENINRLSSKIFEQIKIEITTDRINKINDERLLLIAASKESDEEHS